MLELYKTAERPDLRLWVRDEDENLINFSGYSFVFKIGIRGSEAVVTKTSGITGAAGAGVEPTGTPNVVITFTAGDLDSIPAQRWHWQLRATTGSTDRLFSGDLEVIDVIT